MRNIEDHQDNYKTYQYITSLRPKRDNVGNWVQHTDDRYHIKEIERPFM